MNLAELLALFKKNLQDSYDEDEIQSLFFLTIREVLNYNKADFILKKQELLAENLQLKFNDILNMLTIGKPIQYVFGYTEFYGLKFKVNPSVLIPRPETEELVEWILSVYSSPFTVGDDPSKTLNILDIGTGSGCIAIALKKHLPNANISALDISFEALATARENSKINEVEIDFIKGDILNHSTIQSFNYSKLNIIVSNPPYIKEDEKTDMHQNVLANEPHSALFVSNENPLIFYDAIAKFAKANLKENGKLFFEINEYLSNETVKLLADYGFKDIELKKDMQGKNRMILAHR